MLLLALNAAPIGGRNPEAARLRRASMERDQTAAARCDVEGEIPLDETQVRIGVLMGSLASALVGMAVLAWCQARRDAA